MLKWIKPNLIVRVDDVHPRMEFEKFLYFLKLMKKKGLVGLIGVIPDNKDASLNSGPKIKNFWSVIQKLENEGWEIALHGCHHNYNSFGKTILRGYSRSEFAGIKFSSQKKLLSKGKLILESYCLNIQTFMAPAHSFDLNTIRALSDLGFKYITDGFGITPYKLNGFNLWFVPQLFGRPHGLPFGLYTSCLHLNSMDISEIDIFVNKLDNYNIVDFSKIKFDKYNILIQFCFFHITRIVVLIFRFLKNKKSMFNKLNIKL